MIFEYKYKTRTRKFYDPKGLVATQMVPLITDRFNQSHGWLIIRNLTVWYVQLIVGLNVYLIMFFIELSIRPLIALMRQLT